MIIVIGNGISRKDFDLTRLNSHDTIGCNALYRDYPQIKYLCAVDQGMIKEILHSTFDNVLVLQNDRKSYCQQTTRCTTVAHKWGPAAKSNTSGGVALDIAGRLGEEKGLPVYILGFDVKDTTHREKVNMYGGSVHYTQKGVLRIKIFIRNYVAVFEHHPNIQFINVINEHNNPMKLETAHLDNYSTVSYEEFEELI